MPRIATVRIVLALLGVVLLLVNPAGICAGTMGATQTASHPCCPKPAAGKAPCVCIDKQTAAPTLPPLADQPQLAVAAPAVVVDLPAVVTADSIDEPDVAVSADAILLPIHQLLL
jgi:hypothetical protein